MGRIPAEVWSPVRRPGYNDLRSSAGPSSRLYEAGRRPAAGVRAGAATLAQDRATSVVYGMPGAAAALGAAGQILPLPSIGDALMRHCGTAHAAAS
jgi:hypothetical protein